MADSSAPPPPLPPPPSPSTASFLEALDCPRSWLIPPLPPPLPLSPCHRRRLLPPPRRPPTPLLPLPPPPPPPTFAVRSFLSRSSQLPHRFKVIAGATPFGAQLKDFLVSRLREYPGIEVVDLGDGHCHVIAADVGRRVSSSGGTGARGLVVSDIGSSVCTFTNKFPGAFATACLSVDDAVNARSINNCNILAISALFTPPGSALEILDAWLDTPFKSPCPASNGLPWSDDVLELLDRAQMEMGKIRAPTSGQDDCASCAICCLVKGGVPNPFDMIPGGSVKIIREHPIAAIVRFEAGSVEPPHHHTSAHDQAVLEGKMSVWNLTKNQQRYDLVAGEYLFTPGGDVHMVKYHEDTEFLVTWYGHCDMFFHEHLEDC